MENLNFIPILVAALVPMVLGAIYYGPLMEKHWLDSMGGKTKEDMVPDNMPLTYGLALLMAVIISFFLNAITELTHKGVNDAGELIYASHHTFGHGALHGAMTALTIAAPVIVSLGLFQKSSGKNILINVVFWVVCFAIMGGITDAWN